MGVHWDNLKRVRPRHLWMAGKRPLAEAGSGAVAGGGIGYATASDEEPAERIDNVAKGALIGALVGIAGGQYARKRRVNTLIHKKNSPEFTKDEKYHLRILLNKRDLKDHEAKYLLDNSSPDFVAKIFPDFDPSVLPNGRFPGGAQLVSDMAGTEFIAKTFGEAKAMQTAYGTLKENLIRKGYKDHIAANYASKAIFKRTGKMEVMDDARKLLNGTDFKNAEVEHASRFLSGNVKLHEITREIEEYAPVLALSKNHLGNPGYYHDIKRTMEKLKSPQFRQEHQGVLGVDTITKSVDMNNPFGLGKFKFVRG